MIYVRYRYATNEEIILLIARGTLMRWVNYIFQSTLNFYRYIYWDSI